MLVTHQMQYLSQAHHIIVMQMGGKIAIHGAYDPLLPKNMSVVASSPVTTDIISDRNNNEEESKQHHNVVLVDTRHLSERENNVQNGDRGRSDTIKVIT